LLTKKKINSEVLQNALDYLVRARKIGEKDGKYYLYRTKSVPWKKRYNNSISLIEEADKIALILSKIPWVQLIGVTGAVAACNATKDDDIDFFIVTKAKRMWVTRGFVFLILVILGKLRTDANPNRKVCPNIFVDETNLAWDKKARNVYVAHEIVLLHPLFERDQTYFKFLQKNDWAFKYFGNQPRPEYKLKRTKKNGNLVMRLIEGWAYNSQVAYMKDKKTQEITDRNKIHFRKVDNTDSILKSYKAIRNRLGLKSK
jgi:hypothetical protein